jgi:hypothetical protein
MVLSNHISPKKVLKGSEQVRFPLLKAPKKALFSLISGVYRTGANNLVVAGSSLMLATSFEV